MKICPLAVDKDQQHNLFCPSVLHPCPAALQPCPHACPAAFSCCLSPLSFCLAPLSSCMSCCLVLVPCTLVLIHILLSRNGALYPCPLTYNASLHPFGTLVLLSCTLVLLPAPEPLFPFLIHCLNL